MVHTCFMAQQRQSPGPRGATTRARILAIARRHFAARGYDRATIRAIAADAGIDPSLVMRYFTNKQGLFLAAAEFDLRLPDFRRGPRSQMGTRMVEHFLDVWESDDTMRALLRTAATNAQAARRMRSIAAAQATPAVTAACGDPHSGPVRASLISSQLLGFAYCRYVLKLPPLASMQRAEIVKWLGSTVQHYLFARLPP